MMDVNLEMMGVNLVDVMDYFSVEEMDSLLAEAVVVTLVVHWAVLLVE